MTQINEAVLTGMSMSDICNMKVNLTNEITRLMEKQMQLGNEELRRMQDDTTS